MTEEKRERNELTDEELDEAKGEESPDREVMSVLDVSERIRGLTIDPPPTATE